jgi:hypothetical protein
MPPEGFQKSAEQPDVRDQRYVITACVAASVLPDLIRLLA